MRFKLAKKFVGETLSDERITEDSFLTVKDQVSRFLNLGIPVNNPDFYDIDESKGDTDENIVPYSVYGEDPVEVVKHAELVKQIADNVNRNRADVVPKTEDETSSVSLPQGSSQTDNLADEALKSE
ncbi:hypothetical protein [Jeotgalibaca porci]|uniref:hypothetical protein n=1 Tax=Jeotgalibaca porci TaxID=1868793 RepID=UPI00359F8400